MIDKPVPNVQIEKRAHPPGKEGAKISLQEVADRAWKARMSPRLRAWVLQELDKCGVSAPGDRRKKAQCVLDAFRKKVPYVPDPLMGEFIATPDQVLCLDEGGLCIIGSDCDECSVTLAASMMTIGIPAMIIGSSHRPPTDLPTHVFVAFEDDHGNWVKMDGTTKFPVGKAPPSLREWWVEPGKEAKDSGVGDFVGMSGAGTLGATPARRLDLLYPWFRK